MALPAHRSRALIARPKFASVGISEVLASELADSPIGFSVLCPELVKTRMLDNGATAPRDLADRFVPTWTAPTPSATSDMRSDSRPASIRRMSPGSSSRPSKRDAFLSSPTPNRRADVEHYLELMSQGFDALAISLRSGPTEGASDPSMMDFSGKTAFVTGAATHRAGHLPALARSGVNIVLRYRAGAAEIARRELSTFNSHPRDRGRRLRYLAFERAAESSGSRIRNIHFLFNNAAFTLGSTPLWEVTPAHGNGFRRQHFCVIKRHPDIGATHAQARRGRTRREHRIDRRLQVNPKLRNAPMP